ncbi:helix-turn-helix transcriptional regulator [Streptomyces sp. NPDC001262]|uniref:helix-turn-helix transcriptional regulator n=1 Tax=Streptomyces sp. NPDC001262 TaxID=3364552 RepID=UPI003680A871
MSDRLLSVPTVAERLDVSRRTIYRFIAAGELSIVDLRTGGERSRVRIPSADVEALIERRAVAPPKQRAAQAVYR